MEYAAIKKEIESTFNRTTYVDFFAFEWPVRPRIKWSGVLLCSGDNRKCEMMLCLQNHGNPGPVEFGTQHKD